MFDKRISMVSHPVPLRMFLIGAETELAAEFHAACARHPGVEILRSFPIAPSAEEALQYARIYAPNGMFLDVTRGEAVIRLAMRIQKELPGLQVVAFGRDCDPDLLLQLMRAGIQHFLRPPFRLEELADCFDLVRDQLRGASEMVSGTNLVYSFLPAKAGVGTSTLAVNASIAAARLSSKPVFFGDFDLSTGVVRFMMKLHNDYSVVDAATTDTVDRGTWSKMVTSRHQVDFLHAGTLQPETRVDPIQVRRLLEFLRRPYKVVCADLSGNFEKYSIEIMRQSRRIFLVTTPELPSLHLARERIQYLRGLDLGDRVCVLVNRTVRNGLLTEKDIASVLGTEIHKSFVNDYAAVSAALHEAEPVSPVSPLGRQITELGESLLDGEVLQAKPESQKKFLEFFSLPRLRTQSR